MKDLNQKLAVIQTELKAKKSSYNAFGKYYFRKAEDIIDNNPVPVIKSTAILSDGENHINATAIVGVDLNQKGMQTAQQFGAASSYGKKYALGNLFLIDDTADADSTNSGGKASQIVNKAKAKMNDDQWDKAVKFVSGGGSIAAIESKYTITPDQRNLLTLQEETFKDLNK